MSVDTTTFKQEFTMGSGVAAFTFTFAALQSAPTSIKCKKINATGTVSTLAYTTDYSVVVNVDGSGGVLTVVNSAGTDTLFVYRDTADKQESDYNDFNQFPANTVEADIDRRTLISQESNDAISRAVKFAITSDISDIEFPTPVDGKVMLWSGTGGTLTNSDFLLGSYTTLAASSATVAQNAATSAATSATNAATSETNAAASEAAALVSQKAAGTSATLAASSATVSTAQAMIATTQANLSISAASISVTQANLAISAASISVTQANLAISAATVSVNAATTSSTQALVATTQATLATSSATVATAQAMIATTQATIATTQANISITQATLAISAATVSVAASLTIPSPTTGSVGDLIRVGPGATAYELFDLGLTTPGTAGCINIGIATTGATPTWTTQCDYNKLFGSAGRASGGEVTSASTTSINIAAGTGFIKAIDSDTAELLSFDWPANNGVTVETNSTTYVKVEYNGGSPRAVITTSEDWDLDTSWPLATIVQEGSDIHILNNPWWVTDGMTNIVERFQAEGNIARDQHIGGLIISADATAQMAITAGVLWSRLNEFDITARNFGDLFETYWRTTSTIWTNADVPSLSNLQFNNLATNTLDSIPNNRYVNWWIYSEAEDDIIAVVYPQASYVSAAGAEAETPPTAIPQHLAEHAILAGRVIIKQGTAAPVETQSAFDQVFTASLAADHGNLTGLSDDDHTQYLLATGTRTVATLNMILATAGTLSVTDITISGGSAAALTVSNIEITAGIATALTATALTVTTINVSSGTIAGAVTGVTQSPADNSTKLATTAYTDAATPGAVTTFATLTITTSATIELLMAPLATISTLTVTTKATIALLNSTAATIGTISLTGGQMKFPATQSASADANTLDDYEEGAWTPGYSFGGASANISYTTQLGRYTKIGNLVTCEGTIVLSNNGTSTGNALVTGLPFTVDNAVAVSGSVSVMSYNGITFANQFCAYPTQNATTLTLMEMTEVGGTTPLTDANIPDAAWLFMTVTYRVK